MFTLSTLYPSFTLETDLNYRVKNMTLEVIVIFNEGQALFNVYFVITLVYTASSMF